MRRRLLPTRTGWPERRLVTELSLCAYESNPLLRLYVSLAAKSSNGIALIAKEPTLILFPAVDEVATDRAVLDQIGSSLGVEKVT